jgi:hypothetical protein
MASISSLRTKARHKHEARKQSPTSDVLVLAKSLPDEISNPANIIRMKSLGCQVDQTYGS